MDTPPSAVFVACGCIISVEPIGRVSETRADEAWESYTMKNIFIKRIYDEASPGDGTRVLVDRLWPRGVAKEEAAFDVWEKDLAPSSDLRQWFGHDPNKFADFTKKYLAELNSQPQMIEAFLNSIDQHKRLTLLTATKDPSNSHAAVLKDFFESHG